MKKFTVYMKVAAMTAFTIEAETSEDARRLAEDEHLEESINLCHQCSDWLCDHPVIGEVAEVIEDAP